MTSKQFVLTLLDYRHNQEAGFMPLMAAIESLNAKQACWRPDERSHSIWELVNHITFWNQYTLYKIQGNLAGIIKIENDETFRLPDEPNPEARWQEAVQRVGEVFQALRHTVSELSESDLDRPFDDQGTPVKVVLADLAMHDAYHIGQILYIRKLQGWTPA